MSIEKRIEKLEQHTGKVNAGSETLIKYRNGEVVRFSKGDPPWQTTIIEPAYEQNEDERKRFAECIGALFNGEKT